MQTQGLKTVVIAEELGLLREGIASLCEHSGRYRVLGATSCGEQAWRLIEATKPDVALIDLQAPRLHALEIARRLAEAAAPQEQQATRCVILTLRTDRKTVLEALRAGAQGFFLKSGTAAQLQECLQRVLDGGIYVSPGVDLQSLFTPDRRGVPDDPLERLSPREYQVFSMLVEGVRPKEIAARLGVSPKTVDTYRSHLMKKLDIHDVAGLVKYALQRHFIRLADSAAAGPVPGA